MFVCVKGDCNITTMICHALLQSSGTLQKDLYLNNISIVCINKIVRFAIFFFLPSNCVSLLIWHISKQSETTPIKIYWKRWTFHYQ